MKKSHIGPVSIPCHIRDIRNFLLRNPKYLQTVDQFSKYESLPVPLLNKLFKRVQHAKTLKAFQLKWSYFPALQVNPGHIKSIFKHHCKTIEKHDVLVLEYATPYDYKNLFVPLKQVKTASVYSNKDIKRALALKNLKKLIIRFTHEIPNYTLLRILLRRLIHLKNLYFTVTPNMFSSLLGVIDQIEAINERNINIEFIIEGDQENLIIPKLKAKTRESIQKLNFQSIRSETLLNKVLAEKIPVFSQLKSLMLGFSNITTQTAICLGHLSALSKLEHLSLVFTENRLKNVAAEVTRRLKFPPSLVSLELSIPLYLRSLVCKNKVILRNPNITNLRYPWRHINIFEDEPSFNSLFHSLANAKGLKTMTLDFNMLEEFNPHYTNFIVSILKRVPNLCSFETYLKDTTLDKNKESGKGCFDLFPFLEVCSKLEKAEQIEISMPNLLFDDAEFHPSTKCLKSLTIGVNENDEDKPLKFTNISRFVKKLLKTLYKTSPDLVNLTLDFNEVVDETKLLMRFCLIERFKKLEGLGLRFTLKKCDQTVSQEVGRILQALRSLNTMVLKFTDSNKKIYGIQNFIKYHKSLRDMLVQLNESSWIDNDYFMDPLRCQIMQDFLVEDQDGGN